MVRRYIRIDRLGKVNTFIFIFSDQEINDAHAQLSSIYLNGTIPYEDIDSIIEVLKWYKKNYEGNK